MLRWSVPLAAALLAGSAATGQPALTGALALGEALYADKCLSCHGPTGAEGEVGDIRGLGLATITSAVRGGPGMMPTIPLTPDEIAAIAAYLADM